ncbi:MAG: SPFH domain-containing protein [Ardenticatenaceae bacterium]
MIDNLLHFITIISWVLFGTYTFVFFIRNWVNQGLLSASLLLFSGRIFIPLLAIIALNLLSLSLVFVQPPEVGVVISVVSPQGVRKSPFQSGLHWTIPLIEQVQLYPIAWQTYTMSGKLAEGQELGDDSIRARTRDGQEVLLDCSIIFRIDPKQAVRIHIDWQQRYIEDFVRPVARGFVRTQVSQFTVTQVNSEKRKDLEAMLDQLLSDEFENKGLILDQFLLRDITFSEEYAASIEQKQVALEKEEEKKHEAEQLRQLAQGRADALEIEAKGQANAAVTLAEGEAKKLATIAEGEANAMVTLAEARSKSLVIEGEGQAKALELVSVPLNKNPNLLIHEYIEKLTPNIRVMLLPNNTPLMLPLPELSQTIPITNTLDLTRTLPSNQ